MEHVRMQTKDMASENFKKLSALFPNCVTEVIRKDEDGNDVIEHAIDKDKLAAEINGCVVDGPQERYQFNWPGKRDAIRTANAPSTMTLRPCKEESVDFDNTQNLYIEGDNLEVLKLLQNNYLGKVKMIYIDPPYNTGNDFVYNDDFKQDADLFNSTSGMFDENGNMTLQNFEKNSESNGRFHTDWLNMMYPRLKIARNLLKEDGVIFISIDDNEVHNLKKVFDEIFGDNNFVANLVWQKKFARSNDATYFSTMHDHILCYCKNNITADENGWKIGLLPRGEEIPSGYANPDNDPRGLWTSVVLSAKSGSQSLIYEITCPSGRKVLPPSGRYWSCSKETLQKWISDNRIWFGSDGDGTPRKKTFLSEVQAGLRPNTLILHTEGGHNQEGKQELKALFDGLGLFDGPKPVRLLQLLLTIGNVSDGDVVLDFFSGSATTAHSVFAHNANNQSSVKFILTQLPEIVPDDSEAKKSGYQTICEIGKERIRRAGRKIKDEAGLTAQNLDIGFRVLKLAESNMNDVFYKPGDLDQGFLDKLESNVKPDRTDMDLLFQVMLECDLPLSSKIEEKTIQGKKVFFVEGNELVACFDKGLTTEIITEIAKTKPYYFITRDSALDSDNTADNFEQIWSAYSKDTIRKVL